MDGLANDIFTRIQTKTINMDNLANLVLEIIQITEQIQTDGNNKLKITMIVIERIINESNQDNKEDLILLARKVVPQLVNVLISVDRGDIVIAKKYLIKCLPFCV